MISFLESSNNEHIIQIMNNGYINYNDIVDYLENSGSDYGYDTLTDTFIVDDVGLKALDDEGVYWEYYDGNYKDDEE